MTMNTTPVFTAIANMSWGKVITGNTALDGTGTTVTLFTADATNGSAADRARSLALGTNVATVLRIFANNGSTPATAANNSLIGEMTIPANTLSQVAASILNELLLVVGAILRMPAGYKLLGSVGTTIAAGLQVTIVNGGNY